MSRRFAKRRLAVRAGAALLFFRIRLPRRLDRDPLQDVLADLTPSDPAPPPPADEVSNVANAFAIVEAACRRARFLRDTCFYRAIARYAAWRLIGVPARFVMAVRRESSGSVAGHAWVERDGIPDGDEQVGDYIVTFAFPD